MMVRVFVALFVLMCSFLISISAQARDWEYREHEDPMTDEKWWDVSSRNQFYFATVRCIRGKVSMDFGYFDGLPKRHNKTILVRFDKELAKRHPVTHLKIGGVDRLRLSEWAGKGIIESMKKHNKMLVQVHTYQNERFIRPFSLKGFSAEMAKFPPECQ